jgi:hypothetical protein
LVLPPGAAADVPPEHEAAVILAAEECPGEIIWIEYTGTFDGSAYRIRPPEA